MSKMRSEEIPFLRNIGLLMTYRCQVACPHCVVEAGPHRKEEVVLDDALSWLEQIARYRSGHIRALSITGGEPFFARDKLKSIVASGAALGLTVTVVTNAFWAASLDQAVLVLREIQGLKMIGISSDSHHQKLIPFSHVENAVRAAQICDLPYKILVATENEDSPNHKRMVNKLLELAPEGDIQTVTTFLAGRALAEVDISQYMTSETPCHSACPAAGAPVIFPDGRVVACVGALIELRTTHPLVLGNLRENSLSDILENAEGNPILHAIRIWGPKKLIALIEESGMGPELPKQFIKDSLCDPCYRIFSNQKLVSCIEQIAADLGFQRMVAYGRLHYLDETKMLKNRRTLRTMPGSSCDQVVAGLEYAVIRHRLSNRSARKTEKAKGTERQ